MTNDNDSAIFSRRMIPAAPPKQARHSGLLVSCVNCGRASVSGSGPCPKCGGRRQPTNVQAGGDRLSAGTIIGGRYRVIGHLGRGGFADVYLVRDGEDDHPLVMKVPRPGSGADSDWAAMFVHEAELWIKLGVAANIVTARDVLVVDARVHLILDYVEGGSLLDSLAEPLGRKVRLLMHVANGLSYAWRTARIVHGDLSPSNILVARGSDAQVTDFGLAFSLRGNENSGTATPRGGTPGYMSPEMLADPSLADNRSDVYSFGVVAYQLVTGQLPFAATASDNDAIRAWHQSGLVIPPSELSSDVPENLSSVIVRCLHKEAAQRFQDFEEVWEALKVVSDTNGFTGTYDRYRDDVRRQIDDLSTGLGFLINRAEHQGLALQELGKHEEAIRKFEEALRSAPRDVATWWNKGNSHAVLEEDASALKCFRKVVELDPKQTAAHLRIGKLLYRLGELDEALTELSQVVDATPESDLELGCAYNWRGQIYCRRRRFEEAERDLGRAAQLVGMTAETERSPVTSLADLRCAINRFEAASADAPATALDWLVFNGALKDCLHNAELRLRANPGDLEASAMKAVVLKATGR